MAANKAVSLDGSSGIYGTNCTGNTAALTASMFIYINTAQHQRIFFGNFLGNGPGWAVGLSDTIDNEYRFYLGFDDFSSFTSPFASGTWYHVAYTYDGTSMSVWINGVLATNNVKTLTYSSVPPYNTIGCLFLNSSFDHCFDGSIAALGVWNRALTGTEIGQLYNGGVGASYADLTGALLTSGLISYYDFGNPSALGNDSTVHANHLTSAVGTPTQADGPGGGGPVTINVSSATNIALATAGSGFRDNAIKNASATSQVVLVGTATGQALGRAPLDFTAGATTSIRMLDGASNNQSHVLFADGATGFRLSDSSDGGLHSFFSVSVSTSLNVKSAATGRLGLVFTVGTNAIKVSGVAKANVNRLLNLDATTVVEIDPQADSDGQIRFINAPAMSTVAVSATASAGVQRIINVNAASSLNVYNNTHVAGDRLVDATTAISINATAGKTADIEVDATSGLSLASSAPSRSRDINVSAATAMGFTIEDGSNQFLFPTGVATVALSGLALASIGWNECFGVVSVRDLATASVELPGGGSVPGGDANSGLRAVAYPNVSGTFPFSYAETPSGLLLLANGVDPMLRWDGLSGLADTAGVKRPETPINVGGQDVGTLTGMRYAFCRFVDRNGNVSAISPLSNAVNLGRDGGVEALTVDSGTGIVSIRSLGHGLSTGEPLVFGDIGGLPVGGIHYIAVIDDDHFSISDIRLTSGNWTGGGWWVWGVNSVVYQNVPVPTEGKVVRRQILRNLDGSADVFYVDIDTTDLISSTISSTKSDEQLAACESAPLTTDNELPYASRYAVPPSHKSIVASHMGRIFACGEVAVTYGNVATRYGSPIVRGIGTDWPGTLAGRLLYVSGAKASYEIASVDVASQVLTLTAPYADPSLAYSVYAIRPAPGERRLVYYTEPGLPEAWPPWNSFAIPEEDDEIVGMFARTGFLYFVEKRHIHRFTMQDEPSEGETFASINRGCINGRCLVQVENTCYLLDEAGIHAFDGGQATEPISTPIQALFQSDGLLGGLSVDWSADTTLWHASHDPVRNTVRWFVKMESSDAIDHAICYEYRQKRWWVEQYPTPITSSATGVVGYRRALCGLDARRVVVLGEGALDLVAESASGLFGTVSDADSTSLNDVNANFPANLSGAPVSIVYGASGRRQQRIIAENTSTSLTIVEPWDVIPDTTCTYQVGGVQWSWRSGWFEHVTEGEEGNPRDVMLTYQPTVNPAAIDMQLFYDHSADPRRWAYDIDQDGVSVLAGDPNVTVNLMSRTCRSGWSLQRFGGHSEVYGYGEQYVQILLAGVQCAESIRIFQITMNGVRASEDT